MDDALRRLLAEVEGFRPRDLPLIPARSAASVRPELQIRFDFDHPRPLAEVIDDVCAFLRDGTNHSTHPRHMGLFNPTTTTASVAADALAALYNPQLSVTVAAPFAVAAERYVLGALATRLGLDPAACLMNFTTGGAEANHTAVLCALSRAVPEYIEQGLGDVRPTVYVSEEAHASTAKAVQVSGAGRRAMRVVGTDRGCRFNLRALRKRIADDRAAGCTPTLIVATVGTTSSGAIDPVRELVAVAREAGAWLHVDAAWGGLAALSPTTQPLLDGVAEADSVTWDAHKSMPVSMGAGMFFCRHPEVLRGAFGVDAPYMMRGHADDEPFLTSLQWSRRFVGLKVLMTLATQGWQGIAAGVARQFARGERLRAGLAAAGYEVLNDTPLPVVCFTCSALRSGSVTTRKVLQTLWRDGSAWISETRLAGRVQCLRACVTHVDTTDDDVDAVIAGIRAALPLR